MSGGADLHTHTTASDGRLTPAELVRCAVGRGVKVLAITDHDSTDGLGEAFAEVARHPEMTLVPGIELSTDVPNGEVHVLGYYMDYGDEAFQETLQTFREARIDRARRMVEKLAALGMPIDWERVKELAGDGAVGRPHIAQALVERGHVADMREAFEKWIGRNGPAYAERHKLLPEDAVRLLTEHGGLPVLAHPGDIPELDEMLERLKAAGLIGMEVYYADYPAELQSQLLAVAERHSLIPLGGSDFHGPDSSAGVPLGHTNLPLASARRLIALRERHKLPTPS
ncbi:MAG: PHP domain-containing protein [Chloroflexi bacterium]|nr:PHP domain-containing protein [Chloroflexota bacterium]